MHGQLIRKRRQGSKILSRYLGLKSDYSDSESTKGTEELRLSAPDGIRAAKNILNSHLTHTAHRKEVTEWKYAKSRP